MTTEFQKIQTELSQENEALKKELGLIKEDEVGKEASLLELRKQCNELAKSKSIEVNLLMTKPRDSAAPVSQDQPRAAPKGKPTLSKASKNLQFAKDLNREMELMFAGEDFPTSSKPAKKGKAKGKQQRTVQFSEQQPQALETPRVVSAQVLL